MALGAAILSRAFLAFAGETNQESMVTFFIQLEGAPVAAQARGAKSPLTLQSSAARTKLRGRQILAEQEALKPRLRALGVNVIASFSRLANGLKVRAPADQAGLLEQLPRVRGVSRVRRYAPQRDVAVPFIGAPQVWGPGLPNVDGAGVRIGIIDTGIDYTHADFGGSGQKADYSGNDSFRIEPGTFPTAKVAGGYDFVGDDYDPEDPAHAVPAPDPDPLDRLGHGTLVAGVAAGFGVLKTGQTYPGPYQESLDFRQFSIGPGVAPRALLYALKVFGKGDTEAIFEALEWAADPNGDFDFSDRLDVVNLSLGEDFGLATGEDTELRMINHLSELGCVVAVAAGNAGNTFYVAGSPTIATRAISVASSRHNGLTSGELKVISPPEVAGGFPAEEGGFTKPLSESGPIEAGVVYVEPPDACEELSDAPALAGKIALIDRGTCFFLDKAQRAETAGALGIVVVNNVPGEPFVMGGEGSVGIPGLMISKSDGDLLKTKLGPNLVFRLDGAARFPHPELADTISDFSSRGPGTGILKPEIAAPGDSIRSALAGSGNGSSVASGTSLSTPLVAGAAALLKQLHPDWPVEDLKAAMMNTAAPTFDLQGHPYPESLVGAGRLRIGAAAQTPLTAAAEEGAGLVSLSFGDLQLTNIFATNRVVRLKNHGTNDLRCEVRVSNTVTQAGFTLAARSAEIVVPAGGFALATFDLTVDPKLFDLSPDLVTPSEINGEAREFLYEASGEIFFSFPTQEIHLPYHASLRAASSFHASRTVVQMNGGTTATPNPEVTIPVAGFSATTNAAASVFELGFLSPSRTIPDLVRAAGDLLAVGAASDAASAPGFSDATLYFGIATAASWGSPQPSIIKFEILIDTDRDGESDFTLYNGPAIEDVPGSDVFHSVLDGPRETGLLTGHLNAFPGEPATPLFNNSVLFLSVPVEMLGLTTNASRIRYQVQTVARHSPSDTAKYLIDTTPWIGFDAAAPILDVTAGGREHTPLVADGQPIIVRVNMQSAAASSSVEPRLMILHHQNLAGERLDIVRFDLSNSDLDADGIPDWWEIKYFGNLATAGAESDRDQDGLTDLEEFRADTNPVAPQSSLRLRATLGPNGKPILSWPTAAGRQYVIQRTGDLNRNFRDLQIIDSPTLPIHSFTDETAQPTGSYFYRVLIR